MKKATIGACDKYRSIPTMREALLNYLTLATQVVHVQSPDGQSYFPDGELTDDKLEAHLAGKATYALNMVSQNDTTKLVVLDLDYHGNALADSTQYLTGLQEAYRGLTDAGITPLVSVSGRKGFGLWVVLDEPVHVSSARQFARALKATYLPDAQFVDLRPDTDKATSAAQAVVKLPPCLHKATGKWSGFIEIDVAPQYVNRPWFDSKPDMAMQEGLIRQATQTKPLAFLNVLAKLTRGLTNDFQGKGRQPLIPIYQNAPQGYLSPCIAGLIEKGVPDTLEYNTANLTLANYCRSAGLSEDTGIELATAMAENSEDHPTGKATVKAKVDNFTSNHNSTEAFQCGFMLRDDMKAVFGGRAACNQCQVKPQAMGDSPKMAASNTSPQPVAHAAIPKPVAEVEVALDALAYAWQHGEMIPNVRLVWPNWEVTEGETIPAFSLAAELLPKPTSSAFFSKLEKWLYANPKYDTPHAQHGAGRFITALNNRKVSQQAYTDAVARLRELEQRVALLSATHDLTGKAKGLSVNKLATDLKGIAEDTLKADASTGALATLKDQIFSELTADYKAGIPTPFNGLNHLLHGGFKGGRMYVLVAPPKAGKTTLVATMMDYAAAKQHPVLYVGYEMARQQMVEYAMARKLRINSRWIETRNLTEQNAKALVNEMAKYLELEGKYLEMWEAGAKTSLADVAAWVERVKTDNPNKTPMVVIDYLQLANTGDPDIDRHQSDTKRVTGLAVACKDLARKTGAVVMALSSITKTAETEGRNSGDLDETSARDSLAIIHAADGVLTLNATPKKVETGKGENKAVEYLDQWQVYSDMIRAVGGQGAGMALEIERKAQDLVFDYPPVDLEGASKGIRARLSLKRHRGATGDVPMYYERAFHNFVEVPLINPEQEEKSARTQEGIKAIQKYAQVLGEAFPSQNIPLAAEVNQPLVPEPTEQATQPPSEAVEATDTPYTLYTELEAAKTALQAFVGRKVGVDIETTGLHPITAQARLLQVSDGETTAIVDLWCVGGLSALHNELMALDGVAHNAVFEMEFFHHQGVTALLDCSMLAWQSVPTYKSSSYSLEAVSLEVLGIQINKELQTSDWSGELTASQLEYAALDAVLTLRLFNASGVSDIDTPLHGAYILARNAQLAVVQMGLNGLPFDPIKHASLVTELTTEKEQAKAKLAILAPDLNWSSRPQYSMWLKGHLDEAGLYHWPKTRSGQLKTGTAVILANGHLLPEHIREPLLGCYGAFAKADKILSAFGDSFSKRVGVDGRLRGRLQLLGTITARMSCSEPNLQNIPNNATYRDLFRVGADRRLVVADYSQAELRVIAALANEPILIDAFNNGLDIHTLTASKVFGVGFDEVDPLQRKAAKTINFGILYGMGAATLADNLCSKGLDVDSVQAKGYIDAWLNGYPAIKKHLRGVANSAKRSLQITTPAGRVIQWKNRSDFSPSKAYNYPVQAGAGEAMMAAMSYLVTALQGLDAKPLLVVHDELLVETSPEDAEKVARAVEKAMIDGFLHVLPNAPVSGLVSASIGQSWADK